MKSVNADLLIHTFNVHLNLGDQGPPGVKGIKKKKNSNRKKVHQTVILQYNFTNGYA